MSLHVLLLMLAWGGLVVLAMWVVIGIWFVMIIRRDDDRPLRHSRQ